MGFLSANAGRGDGWGMRKGVAGPISGYDRELPRSGGKVAWRAAPRKSGDSTPAARHPIRFQRGMAGLRLRSGFAGGASSKVSAG